jgi:hypothetical protein
LYFGGDVGDGTVSFLHGAEAVAGAQEVLPGVYLGGYDSAADLVAGGGAAPSDFKFFARYCGWAPGQLEVGAAPGRRGRSVATRPPSPSAQPARVLIVHWCTGAHSPHRILLPGPAFHGVPF